MTAQATPKRKKRQNSKRKKLSTQAAKKASLKRKSKKKELQRKRKRKRRIQDALLAIVLTLVLSLFCSSFFFTMIQVKGFSMTPTLSDGDYVFIQKNVTIKRFDLIAFTNGTKGADLRRVIGLPGEKLVYEQDTLFIDGQPIDEKFLVDEINEHQQQGRDYTEDFSLKEATGSIEIPTGYYFVLGDNRPYATDSRHYSFVSSNRVIGKGLFQIGLMKQWTVF